MLQLADMKILLAVFFILGIVLNSLANPKPISVSFVVKGEGWSFTALADGSVKGEYGSLFGESTKLPEKSIDFAKLVDFVRSSQTDAFGVETQAGIRREGDVSLSMKALRDDSFFRIFFLKYRKDWKGWNGEPPSERIQKLMLKIGYYKEAEKDTADHPSPTDS